MLISIHGVGTLYNAMKFKLLFLNRDRKIDLLTYAINKLHHFLLDMVIQTTSCCLLVLQKDRCQVNHVLEILNMKCADNILLFLSSH